MYCISLQVEKKFYGLRTEFAAERIIKAINWDFALARSTFTFVRQLWQMKIDLLITSKR